MKTCNRDDVYNWGPCWVDDYGSAAAREVIDFCFGSRETLTALDILQLGLPSDDLLWAALRITPESIQRKFACACALRVTHFWDAPDIVLRYLKTQDESIRAAARAATWAATRDATRAATWAATWDATEAAARAAARAAAEAATRDATRDAARAATWDATWDAARAAARAAEKSWQIKELKRLLKDEE